MAPTTNLPAHPNCRCVGDPLETAESLVAQVADRVRRQAGVRNHKIPVHFVDHPRMMGPRVRWAKKKSRHNRTSRYVDVTASWLRDRQPEWWAMLCRARLLDASTVQFTSFQ